MCDNSHDRRLVQTLPGAQHHQRGPEREAMQVMEMLLLWIRFSSAAMYFWFAANIGSRSDKFVILLQIISAQSCDKPSPLSQSLETLPPPLRQSCCIPLLHNFVCIHAIVNPSLAMIGPEKVVIWKILGHAIQTSISSSCSLQPLSCLIFIITITQCRSYPLVGEQFDVRVFEIIIEDRAVLWL